MAATKLSKYYNYNPIVAKKLEKLVNNDWWICAEILTDVVKLGKIGEERLPVAFCLIEEVNIRNGEDPLTDLLVSCFAMDQIYDLEIAATWVDYRITQSVNFLCRIDKIIWPVDERNIPLQILLRDMLGYVLHDYDRQNEILLFKREG